MERNSIAPAIHYDHIGYGCKEKKIFFSKGTGSFIIENSIGENVFEGKLGESRYCEYTGENLSVGEFTDVQVPGSYRVILKDELGKVCAESEIFEIADGLLESQLKANIKSFFYQRTGVELPKELAGEWARPAAHFDNAIKFHPSMNRDGLWDAHGGWYDAGDYGKYIVNGGVSVATLLLACEMNSDATFVGGKNFKSTFEQPFSLKGEIQFELEFFLRMQDHDGGVFFKVTPEHWDGFMTPVESDSVQKRMILGKSTSSTLNFAGVMAQAHRVYAGSDMRFATRCLAASLRAYEWACGNPAVEWPHNTEGSGGYGDEFVGDEFFWARAMLFRSLQEILKSENLNETIALQLGFASAAEIQKMLNALRYELPADMEKNPPKLGLDWRDTQNLGWIALAMMDDSSDKESMALRSKAREALEETAEKIMNLQDEDPYSLSIRKFIWGSNGDIANHALTLLVVYGWKQDRKLVDYALEQIHFIYGRNPVNVSFVTGSAWSSPIYPHHRICHSDGVEKPIPGLLVGGINSDRQDLHRQASYPSEFPGHSYTDERCSFASNETAINWNSPLTAVLARLSVLLG